MKSHKNYIITGHAEHGKDTACEYLMDNFGISFKSSSRTACEIFVYDELKAKFGYKSIDECFNDRRSHRKLWGDMISSFCHRNGKHALGEIIFEQATIYNGIRKLDEILTLKEKGLVDLVIWIDASERLPLESIESMDITSEQADLIITNNGTKEEFLSKIHRFGENISVTL